MMRIFIAVLFFICCKANAQQVTYSEKIAKDRSGEIIFDIIGKYNNQFLVYKKTAGNHYITVYNEDLTVKENNKLDFIPDKTTNVDIVHYKSFFYLIYQYTKRNTIHCTAVKMDSLGVKVNEPFDIDTTTISFFSDTKIYTTVVSEDKQKILVYKIHRKDSKYSLATMLYNNNLELLKKSRMMVELDERRKVYSDVQVDNEGDLVFTEAMKSANREYIKLISVVTKAALSDSFKLAKVNLEEKYIDEVNIKVDNLNKSYLLNTFYYKTNRGSIEGLATALWNKATQSLQPTVFTEFDAELRNTAKRDGNARFAFDDFFIRNVVLKKDGGFILTAEDYETQTRGNNNWSRWDYLYNPSYNYNSYNFNNSGYYNYYRPYGVSGNSSIRYYYDNILVVAFDKTKGYQWSSVIHKEQFDDDNDNFLSYSTMVNGGQIHFLFNDTKSNQIINNQSINSKGEVTRNPTLKSQEKGYQFMARYAKQTSPNQMLVPCNYRGTICFAKIDF